MLSAILNAFREAFRSLRTNFFQTVLSVLGIIIGVGALVTMLALIDGLEKLARESIANESRVESVIIKQRTTERIDGLDVALEEVANISGGMIDSMLADLPFAATRQLYATNEALIEHPDSGTRMAIRYVAVSLPVTEDVPPVTYGRDLTVQDGDERRPVTTINGMLAARLVGEGALPSAAVGKRIVVDGIPLEVVGVTVAEEEYYSEVMLPLRVLNQATTGLPYSTAAIVNFSTIEEVRPGKEFIEAWFAARYPDISEPVEVRASLDMLKDVEEGFLLFRLVMSFLIGIAVVVGGVGVMNVLLMSIAERTPEIGVRKAVGANQRRIMTQFLSESVAVSFIGSFFGLLVGALFAVVSAAVISKVAKFEFSAVFSWQTMLVVGLVALITGIVFGTYPARRAAGLDPVRAIQRT